MLLKINGIPQGNHRRCERVLRDIPRTFRSVLCLVPFLCLVCGAVPGHAEFAREPLPSDWRGADALAALNRVLFVEEGFTYDCVAGNPDNYLLDRVMKNKRGNCLGLTTLYLLLAERLSLPLHGVYVPSHCFVRYEDGGGRINSER